MFDLFYMGGPLFMGILTILLFAALAITGFNLFLLIRRDYRDIESLRKRVVYIKAIGTVALATGFLGQMLGLFQAFGVIEDAGNVSTSLLASGLKISMISPLYGIAIFILSWLLWLLLDNMAAHR
jgi:biopolymer transport protein ExbB/TolQ